MNCYSEVSSMERTFWTMKLKRAPDYNIFFQSTQWEPTSLNTSSWLAGIRDRLKVCLWYQGSWIFWHIHFLGRVKGIFHPKLKLIYSSSFFEDFLKNVSNILTFFIYIISIGSSTTMDPHWLSLYGQTNTNTNTNKKREIFQNIFFCTLQFKVIFGFTTLFKCTRKIYSY